MINPTIHVRILSPQQLLLDTNASSVSSKNIQGNFDILPQHANFLTVVEKTPIVVRVQGKPDITFKFDIAIIFASQNTVNVYTYIQTDLEAKN